MAEEKNKKSGHLNFNESNSSKILLQENMMMMMIIWLQQQQHHLSVRCFIAVYVHY